MTRPVLYVLAAALCSMLSAQYIYQLPNRLLAACSTLLTISCSRTYRYDGQLFVKPPEVLARDRLLGNYEVGLTYAASGP